MTAAAVGYLYFSNLDTSMQGTADTTRNEQDETSTLATNDEIKGKDSIMSLFKMGKSMECTFVFSGNGMRGEGTGFFDNGNARVDSLYTGNDSAPTASYMISDVTNKVMYTWTLDNGVAQGVKIAIPDEVPESATDAPTQSVPTPSADGGVTPETDVEYNCKPWTVDSSVFVPPRDVEFMDMTSMQQEMEDMQRSIEGMTIPEM